MQERKLTKEDIDKVRDIDGFPIGEDEDIIALSNAPYYTACPNPFIEDFIKEFGTPYDEETDDYHCEPFASDVSEGKTDPIYMAHTYHTKVPYKAIMKYILHYTKPGDIVFDGFCGTGMTGVAAQMCGALECSEKACIKNEIPQAKYGTRNVLLNDLSPMATFLSSVFNSNINKAVFQSKLNQILSEIQNEYGWVYETIPEVGNNLFKESQAKGIINYTIWSDVFICPNCGEEIVFWDVAVNEKTGSVKDKFECPKCNIKLSKQDCKKAFETIIDDHTHLPIDIIKQKPVLINYTYLGKRYQKKPDKFDLDKINKINKTNIPFWYPSERMCPGKEGRRNDKSGITHVHHFFTKRNLLILACLYDKIGNDNHLKFLFTSILQRASKLFKWSKNQAGPLSGTLYISSCVYETSIFSLINNKQKIFDFWKANEKFACVNTASLTDMHNVPNNCIDYIFTDPPFGSNLMYSELSFLWECWLKVRTQNYTEAIVDSIQEKTLIDYQNLMTKCFCEYFRILKPGHWMTVEFHNSKNAVWNSIQEAIQRAGFIIADIRTLDKKQGSFKQVNSTSAVKQDLIISAYKPKEKFIKEFLLKTGTEEAVWNFVRQYLNNLPIVISKNNHIETISERQAFLLWDRMISYHIMNGLSIPIDASTFYKGLDEKFLKRDDMYFLPNQVNEYDDARIKAEIEPMQYSLIISNEKSAIGWLYSQLSKENGGPKTYAQIQPKFMQECTALDKREKMPELSVLLEENFLQDENGKWYIPDLTKTGDIAKLREKNLLKEFQDYLTTKGKLKVFRSEAIKAGFAKLWKDKDYKTIVDVAERLPEETIQEDSNLLMYYDISLSRV